MEETLTRHGSLDEFLYAVFRTAATAGREDSNILAAMMGLTQGGHFTATEMATEAIMLRRLSLDHAGHMGRRTLLAKYEWPADENHKSREDYAIDQCARYCMSHNPKLRDVYFVKDAVRDYCSKKMHHTFDWWAGHIDRSRHTLEFRWAKGPVSTRSVKELMTRILAPAEARVTAALEERGISWTWLDKMQVEC